MVGDEESAGEGADEAVEPEDVGEVDETEGDGAADYDHEPGEEPGGVRVVLPPETLAAIRRASEALHQPGLVEALNSIRQSQAKAVLESAQAHIGSVLESYYRSAVRDTIDAAFGAYQTQINDLFRGVLPKLPDLSHWADTLARAYRESLPPNWDADTWHDVVDLMELTGWSLIWAPRKEVLAVLVEAASVEEAEARLVAQEEAVLDDLDAVAAEVTAERLRPCADGLRDAVSATRAGAHSASQALAAALFTSAIHFDEPTLRSAREKFESVNWMDAPLTMLRRYGVWLAAGRALSKYRPEAGDAVPTSFNRHATVHGYSPEQYRRPNAVAGIMLAASYLRQLQADHDVAQLDTAAQ